MALCYFSDMENLHQEYRFYRLVSIVLLVALVFLLKHDLKRLIDTVPSPPSTPKTEPITSPDLYFFSPDISISDDSTPKDFNYIVKPKVLLYRYSKIIKPNILQNIDTSGMKVAKVKLKKPEKNDQESEIVQQEQSDTDMFFDFSDIDKHAGFSWVINKQGKAIDFNLIQPKNRQPSPRIAQVNNNSSYYKIGKNNKLDDQIAGGFGNRRIVTHIGNFNYTSQKIFNTYYSDFIVRSIGDFNSTIQNVSNAYNARLTVTQNGSHNRVRQDVYSQDAFGTFNRTKNEVLQIGDYNLFRSQQVGVSNTIKTIQQGGFNNIDITQQGNNNSVQVRQSGQSNSVTINQN